MSKRVKRVKTILGIVGAAAFFMTLGVIGGIEQGMTPDFPGFIYAYIWLGIMGFCVWVNNKI